MPSFGRRARIHIPGHRSWIIRPNGVSLQAPQQRVHQRGAQKQDEQGQAEEGGSTILLGLRQ
jgi:hypothetical protein